MDDELKSTFGEALLEVLAKRGFREVGRFDDKEGWYTRTYSNGEMGVRLVYHMRTEVEFIPRGEMNNDVHISVGQVAEFFGDGLRDSDSNDDKARYFDRNFPRIVHIFGKRDRGVGVRVLIEYFLELQRRRYGAILGKERKT